MVDGTDLYLGTANPFDGCEVLKITEKSFDHMLRHELIYDQIAADSYMDEIEDIFKELINKLNELEVIDISLEE